MAGGNTFGFYKVVIARGLWIPDQGADDDLVDTQIYLNCATSAMLYGLSQPLQDERNTEFTPNLVKAPVIPDPDRVPK